jgi:hypothetical protein
LKVLIRPCNGNRHSSLKLELLFEGVADMDDAESALPMIG